MVREEELVLPGEMGVRWLVGRPVLEQHRRLSGDRTELQGWSCMVRWEEVYGREGKEARGKEASEGQGRWVFGQSRKASCSCG